MRIRYSVLSILVVLFSAAPATADSDPVLASWLDDSGGIQCGTLDTHEVEALHQEREQATWRSMNRLTPPGEMVGARPLNAPPGDGDPYAGIVPADYTNPVEHVREAGHLLEEVDVSVESPIDHHRLAEVLDFEAPDWARYLLVEFIPDSDDQRSGLYLRPHRPFVGGLFEEPDFILPWDLSRVQSKAYAQAAYRSESNRSDGMGMTHFVLLNRDMDPAPAGKRWHVALGQLRSDRDLSGTLRVWASGWSERVPLAIEFYYDAQEEIDEVGFFDPTPRQPDGDNPATTEGEAMRWILFQAAEELLDELNFDGMFPIRVLMTTTDNNSGPVGVASSNIGGGVIDPARHAPGRLRARPAGVFHEHDDGRLSRRYYTVPLSVFEREAGTDSCRAAPGPNGLGRCDHERLLEEPGAAGGVQGWIRLLRDFENDDGTFWRWDKNLHDQTGRPNIVNLIKHELMHIVGFSGPTKSQAYVATFDPPRPKRDASLDYTQEHNHGVWILTDTRQHHYGPIASPSPNNPWRNTAEPGPRLQDDIRQSPFHLMRDDGDELADWAGHEDYMRPGGSGRQVAQTRVSADILADIGYARGTWSIQERRLPRHWLDPERSGHGIDLRRVEQEDGSMVHFLHFYTYDADGHPEWYLASGVVDEEMVLEGELLYMTYEAGSEPPQQIDPGRSGTFRLDLDPAFDDPACAERRPLTPDGVDQWLFATFEWELPNPGDSGTWCLEPIEFGDLPAFPEEGSGSWYAADDGDVGWGLSVLTRNRGPRPIVNAVVYYYDADGEPTWAWGLAGGDYMLPYGSLGNGVEIDMLHFTGFCRTCEPVQPTTETAGVLRLQLNEQTTDAHTFNRVELLDLTHPGPAGGHWLREDVGIKLLSSPHPAMFQ